MGLCSNPMQFYSVLRNRLSKSTVEHQNTGSVAQPIINQQDAVTMSSVANSTPVSAVSIPSKTYYPLLRYVFQLGTVKRGTVGSHFQTVSGAPYGRKLNQVYNIIDKAVQQGLLVYVASENNAKTKVKVSDDPVVRKIAAEV